MRRTVLTLVPVLAAAPVAGATLEERVEALEQREAELYHTLEERKEAGRMTRISERVSLSGLVEVEASYQRLDLAGGGEETASDLVLATVQLGLEAEIAQNLGATVVLLHEDEGDQAVEVDEATLDYVRGPWRARLGLQYVPFGVFPTHFVSDPLTLELGETREVAGMAAFEGEVFSAAVYAFNGDAERGSRNPEGDFDAEEDQLRDWGAAASVHPADLLEVGVGVISDLAEADAEIAEQYVDRVGGWTAHAVLNLGPLVASGEYLGALEAFDEKDLDADGDGAGDRPRAWNFEVAWYPRDWFEVAGRLEGSEEFAEQPELQYGLCSSWAPREGVSLSLEYLRGEFDDHFGAGVDARHLVTARLAAEF